MIREVDYLSGTTRIYAILGNPIGQVRSPEMITAEFRHRGMDAVMIPAHVRPADFDAVMRGLTRMANLDGLVLTIPFKGLGLDYVSRIGPQAAIVGSLNALARLPDGSFAGEIFDGIGCVSAIKAAGHSLRGKRVHLIGAGGAGAAIGVAVAFEEPALVRIQDPDEGRADALRAKIRAVDPAVRTEVAPADPRDADFVLNASPVGMLGDARNPLGTDAIPPSVVVFDAIVKPEETPLLTAAAKAGCRIVKGREMMRGQIGRIVDFFLEPQSFIQKEART